jgi:putative endonuclease
MPKPAYIYIMSNSHNSVIYVGVTSDLEARVYQHQNGLMKGFTSRYNCTKLVYFELAADMTSALRREKQIKNYSRNRKNTLIASLNSNWQDISQEI